MPTLVVFDLDFTLWDTGGLWIDCTDWPFTNRDGTVQDASGRVFRIFPDMPEILDELRDAGVSIGIASRTSQPTWARWVLDAWKLRNRFEFEEIYPGSKTTHFQQIQKQSGYAYHEMLFFDDEQRNIDEVSQLGVTSVFVQRGVYREDWQRGLDLFRSGKTS